MAWFKSREEKEKERKLREENLQRQHRYNEIYEKLEKWGSRWYEEKRSKGTLGCFDGDFFNGEHSDLKTINAIESGKPDFENTSLLFDPCFFDQTKVVRHPKFPGIFLRIIDMFFSESDAYKCLDTFTDWFDLEYPIKFCLKYYTFHDAYSAIWDKFPGQVTLFWSKFEPLSMIKEQGSTLKEQAKNKVIGAYPKHEHTFVAVLLVCAENSWLDEMETVLAKNDRFLDMVKMLLYRNKMDELLDWLKSHNKYAECVILLEKMGRLEEAAHLLEKLDPTLWWEEFDMNGTSIKWSTSEQKDGYERKLSQLRSLIKLNAPSNQKTTSSSDELEQMFALGEITKEEFEKMKKELK